MPAQFKGLGISFQYPENWKLDDSDARLGRKSVTVYSPGGAFWSVTIHSGSTDPAKLTQAVVAAMREEYDSLEAEEVTETIGEHEMTGYDLNFYCLDLTNTARVRCLRLAHATYVIFFQADDLEYARMELVFQAMTVSLVQGLDGA